MWVARAGAGDDPRAEVNFSLKFLIGDDKMQEKTTVGHLMASNSRDSMKSLAVVFAVILYAAVIVYTGIHNYNLFRATLPEDQQMFALISLACLEGAAVFLPLAIHFWLSPGVQRNIGYLFYVVNFAIVIANAVLDSTLNKHGEMPQWLNLYGSLIAPATPVLIGVCIALLFLTDPSKQAHDVKVTARAAAIKAHSIRLRDHLQGEDVEAIVDESASRDAKQLTGHLLGVDTGALQLSASKKDATGRVIEGPKGKGA